MSARRLSEKDVATTIVSDTQEGMARFGKAGHARNIGPGGILQANQKSLQTLLSLRRTSLYATVFGLDFDFETWTRTSTFGGGGGGGEGFFIYIHLSILILKLHTDFQLPTYPGTG
jgi:hypothetical protein